jgi:diguanylate cyclase (GGDEF)-like protein/PAS domain S-box-containing protein
MPKRTEFQFNAETESSLPLKNKDTVRSAGNGNGNGRTRVAHEPAGTRWRDSELRYRRLFENTMDGILILDAESGRITDSNPFMETMLGYDQGELLGKTLWEIGPSRYTASSRKTFRQLQAQEYARYDHLPLETKARECKQVEFVSNAYTVDGVRVIQCNVRDITERKQVEARVLRANEDLRLLVSGLRTSEDVLRDQATHDPLTGLFNRRYLDDTLARELSLSWRRGSCLSLVILDVDCFKRINDVFGHGAGDMALREIARVLSHNLRKSDIACRYGGEEFALVLPDSNIASTLRRVEEICVRIRSLDLRHDGQLLGLVTMSAGAATAPEHGLTAERLLRAADEALYTAKQAGRDQVVACESRNPGSNDQKGSA